VKNDPYAVRTCAPRCSLAEQYMYVANRGVAKGGHGCMPPVVINTFSLSCFRYCYWCVLYCVSVQSASIFVSHFLRLRHQTPTGALTLYPAGDFRPPEFPQTSLLFHRSKFLATPPLAHIILFILQHCTQCDVHKITFSASDRPRHIRLHYNF